MVTSIILMNVERRLVNDVAERLADRAEISEVYSVAGAYDLVAIVGWRTTTIWRGWSPSTSRRSTASPEP